MVNRRTSREDSKVGITASTTQTQGNGALTADINEISTVANASDTVTLSPAVARNTVIIINNGANTLQIFPATSDNLGNGVNVSTTLEPKEKATFFALDVTNWDSHKTNVGTWIKNGSNIFPSTLTDKVGINTNSPISALEVKGTIELSSGANFGQLNKIFEESFVGKALNTVDIWSENNNTGTPTRTIEDGFDGGYRITTGTTSNARGSITTGTTRHFNPSECTIWGIVQFGIGANSLLQCGISDTVNSFTTNNKIVIAIDTDNANIRLKVSNGISESVDTTDVARSTSNLHFKIICTGSNIKLYLLVSDRWTLKATVSSNIPIQQVMPIFDVASSDTTSNFSELKYLRIQKS